MTSFLLLFAAGLFAGAMNALAGGGSFISLPVLIATGVPSVEANASSTVALFPGGLASAWTYRDDLGPIGPASLRSLLLTTLIGGVTGAALLMSTPTRAFDLALPWLLLVASFTLAFGRRLGEWLRSRTSITPGALRIIQFGLGVYGGYFGGAVGIMMMAIWGLLDSRPLKQLNAPRTMLVCVANSIAVLIFIVARAVQWPQTVAMLLGATIGGYGGAQIGRHIPARVLHIGTVVLTASIALAFFVRTYGVP